MNRFVIIATAAAAVLSVPSFAGSVRVEGSAPTSFGYATRAINVTFDDAELSTASGASVLLGRVQTAAKAVCGGANAVLSTNAQKVADCEKKAVNNAVSTVHSSLLTEAAAK